MGGGVAGSTRWTEKGEREAGGRSKGEEREQEHWRMRGCQVMNGGVPGRRRGGWQWIGGAVLIAVPSGHGAQLIF